MNDETPAKKDFSTERRMLGEFEIVDPNSPDFYENTNYQVGEEEAAWRRNKERKLLK